MCESRTGGNGKGEGATKAPTPVKAAAGDPLELAHAIVTAAIKCRENTSEKDIPFVVGIRRVEITWAQDIWRVIRRSEACGVRMEPVPDHLSLERAVLLFFREATKGRSDGATKG